MIFIKKHKTTRVPVIILLLLLVSIVIILVVDKSVVKIETITYPLEYSEFVEKYSEQYGVDPYLIYAVIKTESGFDTQATSDAKAIGLMQITEQTFDWIKMKNFSKDDTVFEDLYDPETSIHYGVYLIAANLERYGDISTAAAAYHSGWGTVDELLADGKYALNENTLKEFPFDNMDHYVYKINHNYETYLKLYDTEISEDVS